MYFIDGIRIDTISTGGGGCFPPEFCFLPVTFSLLENKNFRNLKPGSRDMTIFGEWSW